MAVTWRTRAAWLGTALALAAGCNAIAGVDVLDYGAGTGGASAGSAATNAGGSGAGAVTCEPEFESDVDNCGAADEACPVRANSVPACAACQCENSCNEGFGDCDGQATNGCETTLATSDSHCGACGWDCGSASCNGGECGLEQLTLTGGPVDGMMEHDGDLYWFESSAAGGALFRCPKASCPDGPEEVTTTDGGSLANFVGVGDTALFSTNFRVYRCTLPTCVPEEIANDFRPNQLALNATHVHWWRFTGGLGSPPELWRAAIAAGQGELLHVAAPEGTLRTAVDDTHVFWASGTAVQGCTIADCSNTIVTLPVTGTLVTIDELALSDSTLFILRDSHVLAYPRGGGEGAEIVGDGVDCGLRTVGPNLTWMHDGDVQFYDGSGVPTTLADASDAIGVGAGCQYLVDGDFLYVGNSVGIYRKRLPAGFAFQ